MSYESDKPCQACGFFQEGATCFHHLKSRKSSPELSEVKENMISVCLKCHNEFHAKGTVYMAVKYPTVMKWLKENNWYFCKLTNKWRLKK